MALSRGDVLGFETWGHRNGWNGTICQNATAWNCGANARFRAEHCAEGSPRCDIHRAFASVDPNIVLDATQLALDDPAKALDHQLLFLWAKRTYEPNGVRGTRDVWHLTGAYRVGRVEWLGARRCRIFPSADEWVRIDAPSAELPRYEHIGYRTRLRAIAPTTAKRALMDAELLVIQRGPDADPEMRERLAAFIANFDSWQREARERAGPLLSQLQMDVDEEAPSKAVPFNTAFSVLRHLTPSAGEDAAVAEVRAVEPERRKLDVVGEEVSEPPETGEAPKADGSIVDAALMARLQQDYGHETARRAAIGVLTKPMLVLRGHPGVGKSRLATMLTDDPERRLIVAVASTWRGREDLLGYVNPVNGEFEPTGFCDFLERTAKAFFDGDRRLRVVVFEEFNLSPPEYWLSDLLVRMQFAENDIAARTIDLGGRAVRGWNKSESTVFVSPSLLLVGTMNVDHTTRPLSPRVLDRASVVHIDLDPVRALKQANLKLDDDQVESIRGLDNVLRDRSATFSARTAQSLAKCLANATRLELTAWECLDVVLIQEVFSKVRIVAGDTLDMNVVARLVKWADEYADELPLCKTHVDDMSGRAQSGVDSL
jgi:hypothetical protein